MIHDPRKEPTLNFKNCKRAVETQFRVGWFFFLSPKTIPISQPKGTFVVVIENRCIIMCWSLHIYLLHVICYLAGKNCLAGQEVCYFLSSLT